MNFRNLSGTYAFGGGINLVLGPNGSGKTSLLEAIAYLSVPRSFRGVRDYALVRWGESHFFLEGNVVRLGTPITLTAYVEVDNRGNTVKKVFKKDGRLLRTYQDVLNTFVVLSFSSREHAFMDGPPMERRKFFDWALSLLDAEYYVHLVNYRKLLIEKRMLLKSGVDPTPINRAMVEHADYIVRRREEFVLRLNRGIRYAFVPSGAKIVYVPSVRRGVEIVEKGKDELRSRKALYGPHRDRFEILLDGKPVRYFASEGQKRRIHLGIVMFVRDLLEEKLQDSPVMVLDEPFVYLDREGVEGVVRSLKGQVFLSSTHRPNINVSWHEVVLGR